MASRRLKKLFAFTTVPVTVVICSFYVALIALVLATYFRLPSPPTEVSKYDAVNLTEAWQDLAELSKQFRTYNSRRNDEVNAWLLRRIESILDRNNASFLVENQRNGRSDDADQTDDSSDVVLFNDLISNGTFPGFWSKNTTIYYEGNNIMLYIRGKSDDPSLWWRADSNMTFRGPRGVLLNSHYDSVPTGYGATDDGIGVVTLLQLVSHFTKEGNMPDKGIVALWNNNEEDGLNGARAFVQHPLSKFPATLLNLEGAGAGGRATLFRSTDEEITQAYSQSPYPFGSVLSNDAFKSRLIGSETDWSIFTHDLGLRGLDVAFFEPRSQYHTEADDVRHTSRQSLWHMLSAALATTHALANSATDWDEMSKRDSVWFDMFGSSLMLISQQAFFAISVTLLVVSPIAMIAATVWVGTRGKLFVFSRTVALETDEEDPPAVLLRGWRGFSRPIISLLISSLALVGLAFLIAKGNPMIIYSARWTVWAMMLTAFFVIEWFLLRGAAYVRPSALSRHYSFMWLYITSFLFLLASTVALNRYKLGGGYFTLIYFASVFVASLISYAELLWLPTKQDFAQHQFSGLDRQPLDEGESHPTYHAQDNEISPEDDNSNPDETTSLLGRRGRATFARPRSSGSELASHIGSNTIKDPVSDEQAWSGNLASSFWLLEFITICPINVLIIGQIALFITSSLYQTPADGNSVLTIYLFIAGLTVLILAPVTPFIHRFSFHVPQFLLIIFVGTLIFNLLAFPFSPTDRLKVYFDQRVNLESGMNHVVLYGVSPYLEQIVAEIPSAAQNGYECGPSDGRRSRRLTMCWWTGPAPRVVDAVPPGFPPERGYKNWVSYTVTRQIGENRARFSITGKNTKQCEIHFSKPVSNISIEGSAAYEPILSHSSANHEEPREVRLMSREWEKTFNVTVDWKDEKDIKLTGLDGQVLCVWSDANDISRIPAMEELQRFMPSWSTLWSKQLVEGGRPFSV